ncbi:MAG: acyltransferase [Oscillospiraceae bacterium]|jgi:serine/alanine racemase|nr:acyltransferase [Oscillospiraceae bacterium]
MKKLQQFLGIDTFRFICALLVVGVHTYPLLLISEELNFIVFHIFARIAVPFFLMATGYFVIPKHLYSDEQKPRLPISFLKKATIIYIGASLLYLPVSIYAGYFSEGITAIIRNIIFDGTFYHLWYLSASIIGMIIIYLLARMFSIKTVLCISIVLYVFGLLGDSYYGITKEIPYLNTMYSYGFQIFSYTRNGIFLAPVFLILGGWIAKEKQNRSITLNITLFAVSLLLMLTEGIFLSINEVTRHDSMYIFLLPCMYFLFSFLTQCHGRSNPMLREVSMYVYILHPMMIIAIRGFVRIIGFGNLLVSNSIVHYLAVCFLSILLSIIIIKLFKIIKTHKK